MLRLLYNMFLASPLSFSDSIDCDNDDNGDDDDDDDDCGDDVEVDDDGCDFGG